MGRAPGCGGGGPSALAVVVAGLEAGVVRVGAGVSEDGLSSTVLGVMPSGFMGASLWMRIGGMVACWQWLS